MPYYTYTSFISDMKLQSMLLYMSDTMYRYLWSDKCAYYMSLNTTEKPLYGSLIFVFIFCF